MFVTDCRRVYILFATFGPKIGLEFFSVISFSKYATILEKNRQFPVIFFSFLRPGFFPVIIIFYRSCIGDNTLFYTRIYIYIL